MSAIVDQSSNDGIEFDVGGFHFTILRSDIDKHPDSYLATSVKQEWRHADKSVHIKRDGKLFRYVNAFLVTGRLPTFRSGQDEELRDQLRVEADFYNIQELADACSTVDTAASTDTGAAVMSYNTLRSYIAKGARRGAKISLDYPQDDSSDLVTALKNVWAPSSCCNGKLDISEMAHEPLFGTSTVASLDLPELLAAAQASAFGKGTETLLDDKVRRSLEIPADLLVAETLKKLVATCNSHSDVQRMHNTGVELRPYKLVIYQPGGHFRKHRDAVRGEGHIGTLVVILNSPYTGGELEVTAEGHTDVVTGPFRWVAMYGDDMHKINPVTSGTRVSLIYDIYAAGSPQATVTEQTSGQPQTATEDANSQDGAADSDSVSSKESQCLTKHELFGGSYARRGELGDDVRGVTAKGRAKLHTALNEELKTYTSVVICLLHLYPACQAVPGFLKGGDAVLYDLLRDHYDVQVVYCSVYRSYSEDYGDDEEISARMFTPFEQKPDLDDDASDYASDDTPDLDDETDDKTLLVLRTPLRDDKMLDYTPYNDHVGNESAPEERFYVVAGLQVRRKA
jgi:predicted 2-oxoglutarate/Fe(II)-dependent dioxygenase YbiX